MNGGNQELLRWNERFAADDYVFGTRPNEFLRAQRDLLVPGMRALCVADGEGRNSVWLATLGLQVTAFDFSPVALAKASKLAEANNVTVDQFIADARDWDWDAEHYDVVVAIFVQFAPPAQRADMFAGMARALKPGGLLIIQGYRPEQLGYGTGGPKLVDNLYTEDLLRQGFASLQILHLAAHDEVVDEGPGHSGMSALIDLVARKK